MSGRASDGHRLVTVRLVDLPVALHARSREHNEGLMREFRLLLEYVRQEGEASVPRRLLELVRALTSRFGAFATQQNEALDDAVATGRPALTLEVQVPAEAADAARQLGELLDEADEYCRSSGRLLTLEAPPEVVAYRRWYLGQVVDQVAGAPPVPWPALASSRS